ncbi:MAG TPA: four helix bundle protein, partial [Gemmatimonadales bacterium]|nr:four helix bundle protein [Gemmatimonadales bacterium]
VVRPSGIELQYNVLDVRYSTMAIYQRIKAWERCHQLCLAVYSVTKAWPPAERFGLTSQARRAAHSAAANIVEGCAKRGAKEFRRYLDISLGALSELSYTLMLARDLQILTEDEWAQLDELHRRAGGMTWLLYKSWLAKSTSAVTLQ